MPENPDKLNLDQLLALKRAEKPSDEFWNGFQKEFRQRQLQTLIEKESFWSRLPRLFLTRSSVWVPLSAVAVALFVFAVNFQENSPVKNEYFEATALVQPVPQLARVEVDGEATPDISYEALSEADMAPAPAASASFVMDVIPNNQPESLSYTREFPTSTIRSETRAVSALVSYTIARETPAFGLAGGPQTIGF